MKIQNLSTSLFLLILLITFFIPAMGQGAGLVPCGGATEPACEFCHIFVLIKGIIDYVLKIVGVVAALMFIIGGFFFITSVGNPGRSENGKKILTATIIGLAIIFGSWLIINSVMTFPGLVSADFGHLKTWYDPSSWFQANCP